MEPNPPESQSPPKSVRPMARGPPKACLFVANIPDGTTEESLHQLFTQFGEIARITIPKNRPHFAFVQFVKPKSVDAALEAALVIDGQKLRLERSKANSTLFIARMSNSMSQEKLKEICERFGPVEKVTIIMNYQTKTSKGCGFVKFLYREDALACLTHAQQTERFGEGTQKWVVEWALSTEDQMNTRTIFIGGLDKDQVTEECIRERFQAYGAIEKISVVNRPDLEGPAYAFVQYADADAATGAVSKEDGQDWLGGSIRVQFSESTEMKNRKRTHLLQNLAQYLVPIPSFSPMYHGAPSQDFVMLAPNGSAQGPKSGQRQKKKIEQYVPMQHVQHMQRMGQPGMYPVFIEMPIYQPTVATPHNNIIQENAPNLTAATAPRVAVE